MAISRAERGCEAPGEGGQTTSTSPHSAGRGGISTDIIIIINIITPLLVICTYSWGQVCNRMANQQVFQDANIPPSEAPAGAAGAGPGQLCNSG